MLAVFVILFLILECAVLGIIPQDDQPAVILAVIVVFATIAVVNLAIGFIRFRRRYRARQSPQQNATVIHATGPGSAPAADRDDARHDAEHL